MVRSEAEEIFVTADIIRDKTFVGTDIPKACEGRYRSQFNTLRTGDADLRF